jgi:hypothetical protein
MTTHLLTRSLVSILLLGSILSLPSACDQPRVKCVSARGDFAAKYTLVQGTGECASVKGEVIGFQSYNARAGDGTPDFSKSTVALQPDTMGTLASRAELSTISDADATHKLYSLGSFATAEPGPDDFCAVPTLSVAEQKLAAAPAILPDPADPEDMGSPEQAETAIKYEWSNVRIYVNPSAIGTQMVGDLRYTRDGCTATYRVAGVYPAHPCANEDTKKADDRLCAPDADPDHGIESGSGINPDFPVKCDEDLLLCVLTKEPPALKD